VAVLGTQAALDVEQEVELDAILEESAAHARHLGDQRRRLGVRQPEDGQRLLAAGRLPAQCALDHVGDEHGPEGTNLDRRAKLSRL